MLSKDRMGGCGGFTGAAAREDCAEGGDWSLRGGGCLSPGVARLLELSLNV